MLRTEPQVCQYTIIFARFTCMNENTHFWIQCVCCLLMVSQTNTTFLCVDPAPPNRTLMRSCRLLTRQERNQVPNLQVTLQNIWSLHRPVGLLRTCLWPVVRATRTPLKSKKVRDPGMRNAVVLFIWHVRVGINAVWEPLSGIFKSLIIFELSNLETMSEIVKPFKLYMYSTCITYFKIRLEILKV